MADTGIPIRQGSKQQASVEIGGVCVTDIFFLAWLTLPTHCHARASFAIILEGSVDKTFRSASYPSVPSTVVTRPPGERHADRFERAGAHLLVIEPVNAADELLSPCAGVLDRIHHYRDARLVRLAWRAARELAQLDAVSALVIEGLAVPPVVRQLLTAKLRRHHRADIPARLARRQCAWNGGNMRAAFVRPDCARTRLGRCAILFRHKFDARGRSKGLTVPQFLKEGFHPGILARGPLG
jgi:hypothetical protein